VSESGKKEIKVEKEEMVDYFLVCRLTNFNIFFIFFGKKTNTMEMKDTSRNLEEKTIIEVIKGLIREIIMEMAITEGMIMDKRKQMIKIIKISSKMHLKIISSNNHKWVKELV